MALTLAAAGAAVGGLAYWAGLLDRPEFKYQEHIVSSKEEIYVIVALCREKEIAKHVMRFLQAINAGIHANENSSSLLKEVADKYGCPEGTTSVSVGLYFDNPNESEKPRWAIGWAVGTKTFDEAKELAEKVKKESGLEEKVVAARIGPGPVVTGRIPWRNFLTPSLIGPMIHWKRAFDAYNAGGYKSEGPQGTEGTVACEIYVMSPKGKSNWIDYVVLMGNTKNVWNDTFPGTD
mmetsp:Transcript_1786/g.3135  ORF Transcript_1786/g.3135 Transcript_1786/m.3135 type:complete len:235 (-) Transcript_1786:884-1588(-)